MIGVSKVYKPDKNDSEVAINTVTQDRYFPDYVTV